MAEPASASRVPLMFRPGQEAPGRWPWVILPCIPAATSDRDGSIDWRCKEQLRVAYVTVPRHIIPGPFDYLYIAAADRSGSLLLYATEGKEMDPLIVDDKPVHGLTARDKSIKAYLLCNAVTNKVSRLSDAGRTDKKLGMVGLIADPRGGEHYMVAELMPANDSDPATLLCYTTRTDAWVEKALKYSQKHPRRLSKTRFSNGVISHAGKLWWVDLTYGIVTCDPFAEQPDLGYFQLPHGNKLAAAASSGEDVDKRCCVQVSGGKLCCVQNYHSDNGIDSIRMWTVNDPSRPEFTRVYNVPWNDIVRDPSYKAKVIEPGYIAISCDPNVALIDPRNPSVVFFFALEALLNPAILVLDVLAKKVLECEVLFVTRAKTIEEIETYSSRFVHAWELPPSLTGENQGPERKDHCLSFVPEILKICQRAKDPDQPPASSSGAGN